MTITSQNNSKIQSAAKLAEKKFRKTTGLYLVEGARLVADAFKYGASVQEIFVKESVASNYAYVGQTVVSDRAFAKISDTVNSQGIVAVVQKPADSLAPPTANCLVLDGLQDPGNVGTLIRTAAACGFSDVYAANCVDLYSPKVIRSAMSAHFCVRLHQLPSIEDAFAAVGPTVKVAADMDGKNVFEWSPTGNVALVLGNEGNGLSAYSRGNADLTISLPMANSFESLNVAVAGSVIMYRIFSQNK